MISPAGDFASRFNLSAMEDQYDRWRQDPTSVDEAWQSFFAGFELGMEEPLAPARDPSQSAEQPSLSDGNSRGGKVRDPNAPGRAGQQLVDHLIYTYRDQGHTVCDLDPLDMHNTPINPDLDPTRFGVRSQDYEKRFATLDMTSLPDKATLQEILDCLKQTYCGVIGVEYMHIQENKRRDWLKDRIEENNNQPQLSLDDKRRALIKLSQAEMLENFIHTKFLGQKRFSLEGGESLISGLDALVEDAPDLGVREIVIGMAHRGRLNVLANVLNKSYEEIFTEFEGDSDRAILGGDGDVKYHLGFSSDHITAKGRKLHLTLTANPSHLEAVNPIVLGRVRGKQRQEQDTADRTSVLGLLIHGDAAFAGQGLIMETFQMSRLEGYGTGGTVHVVLNNQIGFTTLPNDGRSTRYCTDIAKMVEAPVFHVNGDHPEAVAHVMRLALLYRQTFGQDVVVDLVCYRRHGHNETDEPNYTQPTMYAKISKHPRISELYTKHLLEAGDLNQDEVDGIQTIMKNQLQDALESIKAQPAAISRAAFKGFWKGLTHSYSHEAVETGVPLERIDRIGKALSTWPQGFNIHHKIKRLASERGRIVTERDRVDWALAELLSFGSLLMDGIPVRLSGQDSRRGTFSQRHSYWYDVKTRERYKPLNHISKDQANFCVYNSLLSEAAVMGFDYGYSLTDPNMLIMWEAQFGDFANGAQVMIDQFIASSESKWGRISGLVLLLPHGQEGMGPEHSSARLERFLQMCADDNMQVVYCTTAAQHFHVLRRQVMRDFRKPLICMTPKSHLRSKVASSDISELANGRFQEVLKDQEVNLESAERIILATGKIIHELRAHRTEHGHDRTAIISIEQLHPFPQHQLEAALAGKQDDARMVWCQEEPQNMGSWHFIEPRLRPMLGDVVYAGREAAASPAPGSAGRFKSEQAELINQAFTA